MYVIEPSAGYVKKKSSLPEFSHWHGYAELYYLLSGKCRYIIENRIYDLEAGDVILVPPMVPHRSSPVTDTSDACLERYLISFEADGVPVELQDCLRFNFFSPKDTDGEQLKNIVNELILEDKSPSEHARLIHQLATIRILIILSKYRFEGYKGSSLSKTDRSIQNAALYIKENCHKNLKLGDVAREFFFSREYFSALFKSTIGMGFSSYLTSMRLSKALSLLSSTDLPLNTISEQCGFNDSNYFSTIFKRNLGISPGKYRQNERNKAER